MHFAKIVFIVPTFARLHELLGKYLFESGAHSSTIDDTHIIVAACPRHAHIRAALAAEPDVTVLPGANDPTPIGDHHAKLLAHIKATPAETPRAVLLRLATQHGHVFDPDV